jgi:hypothetical protein
MEFPDGTVGFPEWARWYIPRRDVKRVRPLIPRKFYKLYGAYASMIRRMGLPVEEALNTIKYGAGVRSYVKRVLRDLNSVTQGEETLLRRKRF